MPGDEAARLSFAQASARRLSHHALDEPLAGASAADIAARMCGAHAQVMSAAEWSIGLRQAAPDRAAIKAAVLTERSLVKIHGPRGTVHLLPAADLPKWIGALGAIPDSYGPIEKIINPDQIESVLGAISAALAAADLTVAELHEAVVTACGEWAGDPVLPAFAGMWPRWRIATSLAVARGLMCFGAGRGRTVTYTSPASWLPGFAPADGPGSVGWLITRYLAAYGPATPSQFARWLGTPRRWAVDMFAELAPLLRPAEIEGTAAWLPAGEPDVTPPGPPRGLRLLPYFDPYVIGGHPRELLFEGEASRRALSPTGQAGTFSVLLIDGVVRGIWHQRKSGRKVAITVEPFIKLTAAHRRELADQAERFGAFLGCAPGLTLAPVTVRSHL